MLHIFTLILCYADESFIPIDTKLINPVLKANSIIRVFYFFNCD